jgi:outer membrane protein assembly factor BamE (lipoprotein component of BamABCDE complex)
MGCVTSTTSAILLAAFLLSSCDSTDCPSRFDTRSWRQATFDSDRKLKLARQIEDCRFLKGADKAKVRALLGRPKRLEEQHRSEFRRDWHYVIGETNDYYGPADEQALTISFDRRERVRRTAVSPP